MITIPDHMKDHLSQDRVLERLICELDPKYTRPTKGAFVDLVRIIIGQQVSVAAARSIYGRLVEQVGEKYTPQDILRRSEEDLQACGISRQKRTYLGNIAEYFGQNHSFIQTWQEAPDEVIMEALTSIKGVGEWTAQMMLMFTYRREDVFPTTDVGIQNAMKAAYQLDVSGKDLKRQMENIAEEWRPYRTLACLYLWNYLLKQKA